MHRFFISLRTRRPKDDIIPCHVSLYIGIGSIILSLVVAVVVVVVVGGGGVVVLALACSTIIISDSSSCLADGFFTVLDSL
jgi:hypothetical protein